MNEPEASLIVPDDKQLAKLTNSVNAKLAKFEKALGQAQEQAVEQGGFVDYTTASEIVAKHKTLTVEPPYADEEDEEEDGEEKPSRSRKQRTKQPTWEYRCRNGSVYVTVAGTDDPAVAKDALNEAIARVTAQIQECPAVAVMPPEGVYFGPLDGVDELEVDDEGNVVRSTS